jgi:hypothetical protein
MRSAFRWAVLAIVFAIGGATTAQEKTDKPAPKSNVDPNAVEVRFADGSIVKATLLHDSIEVITRFGRLVVPAADVRRIDFGLRIPEATSRRIEEAVVRLGSDEPRKREAAAKELLTFKELAYPALQKAAKNTDPEVARRARELLAAVTDKVPTDKLHRKKQDTIVTSDFTIVGQLDVNILKARTPHFGEVQLRLAELQGIRWVGNEHETKVVIDSAKFGLQQEAWLDTGVEVSQDTDLQITAGGTVDLYPVPGEAGQYVATPDGMGGGDAANMMMMRGFGPRRGGGMGRPGALLGRIGEKGKVFVIGEKYSSAATGDGKLYLRISPGPWNNPPSGTYDVRIVSAGR